MKKIIFITGIFLIAFYTNSFAEIIDDYMYDAVRNNNVDLVQKYIDQGYNINSDRARHSTPLIWAASSLKYDVLSLLIKKKAKINAVSDIGWTSLHYVSGLIISPKEIETKQIQYRIAKLLVENGADVNAKGGLDVHTNRNMKQTPLHLAAEQGNVEVVKLLVEHDAKVNAKDYEDKTPLWFALSRKSVAVSKYLIEKGADIYLKDKYYGRTPLFEAIGSEELLDVVKLLIAMGSDLKVKANSNKTLIQEAAYFKISALTAILQKAETPEIQALVKAGEKDKVMEILTQVEKEIKEAEKKAKEEAWKIKFENAQKKHQNESLNIQK